MPTLLSRNLFSSWFFSLITYFSILSGNPLFSYFYIFIGFNIPLYFKHITLRRELLPLLLIVFSFFSLLLRNFSLSDSFRICQFFFGFLFFISMFNFRKVNVFMLRVSYIFIALLEYLYLLVTGSHLPYITSYFEALGVNSLDRSTLAESSFRILGPSLNSSVTGTILGVFLLSLLFDQHSFFSHAPPLFRSKRSQLGILIITLYLFILSGSATAFISFGIGLFAYLSFLFYKKVKSMRIKTNFLSALFLVFVILSISLNKLIVFLTKLEFSYIKWIYEYKLSQISTLLSDPKIFLFGMQTGPDFVLGGDFLLLNFIQALGIIALVSLFFLVFIQLSKLSSVNHYIQFGTSTTCLNKTSFLSYLLPLILLLSSIHYGTVFTITGQIIFATYLFKD